MCATNTRTSPLAPRISKCPARVRGEPHPERDFGPLPRIIISIIPKPGLYIHVHTHTHTRNSGINSRTPVRKREYEKRVQTGEARDRGGEQEDRAVSGMREEENG